MYKILIIEDEQIERETLYKILHDNFTLKGLYMAKTGKKHWMFLNVKSRKLS